MFVAEGLTSIFTTKSLKGTSRNWKYAEEVQESHISYLRTTVYYFSKLKQTKQEKLILLSEHKRQALDNFWARRNSLSCWARKWQRKRGTLWHQF
jgi:hypothetical protein